MVILSSIYEVSKSQRASKPKAHQRSSIAIKQHKEIKQLKESLDQIIDDRVNNRVTYIFENTFSPLINLSKSKQSLMPFILREENPNAPPLTEKEIFKQLKERRLKNEKDFSEISRELLYLYSTNPENLSTDQKAAIEGWLQKHPDRKAEIDDCFKNAESLRGVCMTFSDL